MSNPSGGRKRKRRSSRRKSQEHAGNALEEDGATSFDYASALSEHVASRSDNGMGAHTNGLQGGGFVISHQSPEKFSGQMLKYWEQRYRLFSRFDEGIQLDEGDLLFACYSYN